METLSVVDLSLLDKEGGRCQLVHDIDTALSSLGAFYLVGIEDYNEAEFLKWTDWFFGLPEKTKQKLASKPPDGDAPTGYFLVQTQSASTKEGYAIECKTVTVGGVDNPSFENTPWPDCTGFRMFMEGQHAIYMNTLRLLISLVGQAAVLDKAIWQTVAEATGHSALQLFHQRAPAGADQFEMHPLPSDVSSNDGFLFLSTMFRSPEPHALTMKTNNDSANSSLQNGVIVCAGPVLEALTGGRYPSAQYWIPDKYVAEIRSKYQLTQPIFNSLLDARAQMESSTIIKSDSASTMPESYFSDRNSDFLISPLEARKDLESGSDSFVEVIGKRRLSVISLETKESFLSMLSQVTFPFFMAGMGVVGAGLLLDVVQHWKVFTEVGALFIMVPPLLGLKGNLEMTLASRLSTQANLGHMSERKEVLTLVKTNLALVQVQAIVVGLLASFVAIIMGYSSGDQLTLNHCLLLSGSAIMTASAASLILGLIMMVVIVISNKLNVNPDNVATPIAASLGDLITLGLLAGFATLLHDALDRHDWVIPAVIGIFISVIPLFSWISMGHKQTKKVLKSGWAPVLGAMLISSAGGFILDQFVHKFSGFAVFQPVISGVGGNLVAVQASRISTWLHRYGIFGHVPEKAGNACASPCSVFCNHGPHSISALVLLLLVVPGQIIFSIAIKYLKTDEEFYVDLKFMCLYVFGAFLQVLVLLYVANGLVLFLWRKRVDPDNAAIPFLTAFGDLLGSSLLAIAFVVFQLFSTPSGSAHDQTMIADFNETVAYLTTTQMPF